MKKNKIFLLIITLITLFPSLVLAKEKVNVYLFKRDGCGYCANAQAFFEDLSLDEEYQNYFNLVSKEVSKNKANNNLLSKVVKHFNVELTGVPFIVIGDKTFEGYADTYDDDLKSTIKNAYENETEDVVASLDNSSDKENDAAITIIIIFGVVAGVGLLVYMAKNNN